MSDPNENRPGYKETKVGWIPEEWDSNRIDAVATVGYGLTVNKLRRESERKMPYLTVANFGVDGLKLDTIKEIGCLDGDEKRYALKQEDILMVEGNGSRDIVGMGVLWPGSSSPVLHQNHLLRVRVNRQLATPSLIVALIRSEGFRRRLQPRIITSSGLHTINSQVVAASVLPLPPLSEQKKISAILSTCDEAIEKTGALIDAKKRQKKALMQQLLTGKKRLPGFEGEWTEVKIGDLFKEVSRPVEWDDEELYRLISVRRRSGGLFFREALHGKDILTKVMNTTHTGDFLISKMQVVHGAMAMTPPEFDGGHVSGSYITLVAKDGAPIHMPFFDYLSRTKWLYHLTFISSYGVVIEKMTFNLKDFLKKTIVIPPTIEEQERISEILKTCEEEEAALGRKLTALKQQKKSLMQKLLTGQVRVKI